MRHSLSLRTLHRLGVTTALAGLIAAAPGRTANPLGVEWVGGGAAANPAQAPAAGNPLGVDWVGGSQETGPAPKPPAYNPLGVDWVGGDKPAAKPEPSPTSGVRTDTAGLSPPSFPAPPPSGEEPLEPVQPAPEAPPPQPGTSRLAAALIDVWSYQAVAFSAPAARSARRAASAAR